MIFTRDCLSARQFKLLAADQDLIGLGALTAERAL